MKLSKATEGRSRRKHYQKASREKRHSRATAELSVSSTKDCPEPWRRTALSVYQSKLILFSERTMRAEHLRGSSARGLSTPKLLCASLPSQSAFNCQAPLESDSFRNSGRDGD